MIRIIFALVLSLSPFYVSAAQPQFIYVNEKCVETGYIFKSVNCDWDAVEPLVTSKEELLEQGVSLGPGTREYTYLDSQEFFLTYFLLAVIIIALMPSSSSALKRG